MAFSDHKINAFTHTISDLPDQPNLAAAELKARFDSSPEELRQSVNALCDEGEALSARIDSYRAQTFTGEIERNMLAEDVQEELSAKADETALTNVKNTLEAADSNLQARVTALETAVPLKSEVYIGTYQGNAEESQFINLGFTPRAVIVTTCGRFSASSISSSSTMGSSWYGGIATPDKPITDILEIEENGFRVYYKNYSVYLNQNSVGAYFAFR